MISNSSGISAAYIKEPYVGMPIYLDDSDEAEMDDIDNDMKNEEYRRQNGFESWALAMAYVPWQSFEETYTPEEGLKVGTIFPCLNLPFLGGAR